MKPNDIVYDLTDDKGTPLRVVAIRPGQTKEMGNSYSRETTFALVQSSPSLELIRCKTENLLGWDEWRICQLAYHGSALKRIEDAEEPVVDFDEIRKLPDNDTCDLDDYVLGTS